MAYWIEYKEFYLRSQLQKNRFDKSNDLLVFSVKASGFNDLHSKEFE